MLYVFSDLPRAPAPLCSNGLLDLRVSVRTTSAVPGTCGQGRAHNDYVRTYTSTVCWPCFFVKIVLSTLWYSIPGTKHHPRGGHRPMHALHEVVYSSSITVQPRSTRFASISTVVQLLIISHTACKHEFRRSLGSHSSLRWRFTFFHSRWYVPGTTVDGNIRNVCYPFS